MAIVISRRRCPELPTLRFADLMAPVLMACWGMGRLLGPQLMVNGGGHRTNQWFGMYYAGDHPDAKVLPVPIFQAIEDFAIFGILLLVERWLRAEAPSIASDGSTIAAGAAPLAPAGIVLGVGMVLWGIERFLDEHLWLGEDGHLGSLLVQIAGLSLSVVGLVLLASRLGPYRRWRDSRPDPAPAPDARRRHPTGPADGSHDRRRCRRVGHRSPSDAASESDRRPADPPGGPARRPAGHGQDGQRGRHRPDLEAPGPRPPRAPMASTARSAQGRQRGEPLVEREQRRRACGTWRVRVTARPRTSPKATPTPSATAGPAVSAASTTVR